MVGEVTATAGEHMGEIGENADGHADASHDSLGHHISPVWQLVAVFGTLILLTWLTVTASNLGLTGQTEVIVAMGIATVKASLVGLYFMHMRYEKPINIMVFLFTFAFVALFLGLTLMDSGQYQSQIEALRLDNAQLAAPE